MTDLPGGVRRKSLRSAVPYDWDCPDQETLNARSFSWRCRLGQTVAVIDPEHVRRARRILDAGCAYGALTWQMHELWPDKEVIGVEMNADRFEVARCLPLPVFRSHINHLPFVDGHFDLIFALRVWMPPIGGLSLRKNRPPLQPYQYSGEPTRLSDLARVLDPDGRLVLSVWSDVPPEALRCFSYQSEGLEILSLAANGGDSLIVLRRSGKPHVPSTSLAQSI